MTQNVKLIDALDDLSAAEHLLGLMHLAVSGMAGGSKCSDADALAAGVDAVRARVFDAVQRLSDLREQSLTAPCLRK